MLNQLLIKALVFIVLNSFAVSFSQSIYQDVNSDVYDFLDRMSINGIIEYFGEIKPLSRFEICSRLNSIDTMDNKLSEIDKDLLKFYLQEYNHEKNSLSDDKDNSEKSLTFFQIDTGTRMSFFEFVSNDFSLFLSPKLSLGLSTLKGENTYLLRNGVSLFGYYNKNWSFDLNFFDNNESGKNLDESKFFTPERGISLTKKNNNSIQYDVVTASIGYSWNSGSLTLGKDYFRIGSGSFGNIILSDKAPSFPFIRFDFYPVDWLRFFYFHGFLVSNIPDSSTFRYNTVQNRNSLSDVPKFFAFHSISIYPTNKFSFTIGESIVYSDNIQPIYFIPVMFFRVADHYLSRGSASASGNAQLFADASYKLPEINSKFYSSVFIDELSIENLLKGGNLSAIGFTFGFRTNDLLLKNNSFSLEYSRVNPFVYMNSQEAQTFTNDDYFMGHWLGSNCDIISFSYSQFILKRTKLSFELSYYRKGKTEEPDEQYLLPYPDFLYGERLKGFTGLVKLAYKPFNPLAVELEYLYSNTSDEETGRLPQYRLGAANKFSISVSYGF